ncbi:MAG: hypothetical protein ABIK12_17000, partial [Pseudomonadota bacterium]
MEKQWSRLPGYQMVQRQPGSLDGSPGLRLVVRHQGPDGSGKYYRRDSVIAEHGCCFYFLSYAAPERIFDRYQFAMNRLLETFRFRGPSAPTAPAGAAPDPNRKEILETAAFANTALPLWAGPLYSPSLDDGSPLGSEIAADHRRLVGDLARLLRLLDQAQAKLQPLLDQLLTIQLEQSSLVE